MRSVSLVVKSVKKYRWLPVNFLKMKESTGPVKSLLLPLQHIPAHIVVVMNQNIKATIWVQARLRISENFLCHSTESI